MNGEDELDNIMEVMDAAFDPHWREAWTRRQVADSLALPHTYALLIDEEGAIAAADARAAGFVLARRAPGEEELLLVAVRPEFRRRGLGRRLLDLFEHSARAGGAQNVFLEMRAQNEAERLYLAMGYRPTGRRNNYYRALDGTPIDAITFGKSL